MELAKHHTDAPAARTRTGQRGGDAALRRNRAHRQPAGGSAEVAR